MSQLSTEFETLLIEDNFPVVTIKLNRPKLANAMNLKMVHELQQVMTEAESQQYRVLVLKGNEGNFCAGGDIKDMQSAKGDSNALSELNRAFGHMITQANHLPMVVVTALQGAVLGGGFGLACVSDVSIADTSTQFGLPETSLGIIPAQIAPFVVERIGLTQTRRLALLGARFKAEEAVQMGLVHQMVDDGDALNEAIAKTIKSALRCAPEANKNTKALIHKVGQENMETLLDQAAIDFADAVKGEGVEGATAFMQKRKADWAS